MYACWKILLLQRNTAFSTARNFCNTLVMTAHCAWAFIWSSEDKRALIFCSNRTVKRLWLKAGAKHFCPNLCVLGQGAARACKEWAGLPTGTCTDSDFFGWGKCLHFAVEVWKTFSFTGWMLLRFRGILVLLA